MVSATRTFSRTIYPFELVGTRNFSLMRATERLMYDSGMVDRQTGKVNLTNSYMNTQYNPMTDATHLWVTIDSDGWTGGKGNFCVWYRGKPWQWFFPKPLRGDGYYAFWIGPFKIAVYDGRR